MTSTETRAVIPHPDLFGQDSSLPWGFKFETPLQMALHAIRERYTRIERRGHGGDVVFMPIPIDEILSAGLFTIMKAVSAKTLSKQMTSTEYAMEEVAPRVDRLLSAGIFLDFGSLVDNRVAIDEERLVARFHRDVVAKVTSDLRPGFMGTLESVCAKASTGFFASLYKRARQFGEHAKQTRSRIDRANKYRKRGTVSIDLVPINFGAMDVEIEFLNPEVHTLYTESMHLNPLTYKGIAGLTDRLAVLLDQLRIFAHLPYDLGRLPGEIRIDPNESVAIDNSMGREAHEFYESAIQDIGMEHVGNVHLCQHWLRTQLMLAVIDAPDAEHVTGKQYVMAVRASIEMDDDEVIERLTKRISSRGVVLENHDLETVMAEALVQLDWVRGAGVALTAQTVQGAFILVVPEDLEMDENLAFSVASGDAADLAADMASWDKDQRHEYYESSIVPNIDWSHVDRDQLERMVAKGHVPLTVLMTGVAKVASDVRASFIEGFAVTEGAKPEHFQALMDLGVWKPDFVFFGAHPALVPYDETLRLLSSAVQWTSVHNLTLPPGMPERSFVGGLLLLKQDDFVEIMKDPELRPTMVRIIMNFTDGVNLAKANIQRGVFTQLVDRMKETELWVLYVLAEEVMFRETAYEDVAANPRPFDNRDALYVPWEHVLNTVEGPRIVKALGVDHEEAVEILERLPEGRVFHWVFAADSEIDARWNRFTDNSVVYVECYAREIAILQGGGDYDDL